MRTARLYCRRFAELCCLLMSLLCFVNADIYILSHFDLNPLPDMEASFGPDIPPSGVLGRLKLADPEDGCSDFTVTDFETPWIALISRHHRKQAGSNCTFDVKVRMAQSAGAIAAIVYDDLYEGLVLMAKPSGNPEPLIPSVFISMTSGLVLKRMLLMEDSVTLTIVPSTIEWLSVILSALLAILAFLLVMLTLYIMRSWSMLMTRDEAFAGPSAPPESQGLRKTMLASLPCIVFETHPVDANSSDTEDYVEGKEGALASAPSVSNSSCGGCIPPADVGAHAGETKRTCTVCLENYARGDKLRILPCYHRFHRECIDSWLTTHSVCPVCKWDASKPKTDGWSQWTASFSRDMSADRPSLWRRLVTALPNLLNWRSEPLDDGSNDPLINDGDASSPPDIEHGMGTTHPLGSPWGMITSAGPSPPSHLSILGNQSINMAGEPSPQAAVALASPFSAQGVSSEGLQQRMLTTGCNISGSETSTASTSAAAVPPASFALMPYARDLPASHVSNSQEASCSQGASAATISGPSSGSAPIAAQPNAAHQHDIGSNSNIRNCEILPQGEPAPPPAHT